MTTKEIDMLSQPVRVGLRTRPEWWAEKAARRLDAANPWASLRSLFVRWPDATIGIAQSNETPETAGSLETWLLEGLTPSVGGRLIVAVGLSAALLGVL